MTARITIDQAGRVVIPKPLREELELAPGDALELESLGEKITLRPARQGAELTKEKGVWVLRTGERLAAAVTDAILDHGRAERDQENSRAR